MEASTVVAQPGSPMVAPGYDERIEIPAKWRVGQFIVIALILALAVYYNLKGYQSPPDETGMADSRTLFDQLGFLVLAGIVWLTTPNAGTIALATFHEAIRRRWMLALLIFALIMMALSTFFTWMQPGEEEKFLRDFGMGFIIIITLLMAIFLGVALVPPEIERRTIFTILSKPLNRLEFLIGKFLGLCLTLLVSLVLVAAMFLLSYTLFSLRQAGWNWAAATAESGGQPGLMFDLVNLTSAIILQYGQLTIMSALALTLSLIVSNITAVVFCFVIYFAGQASSYWEHLGGSEGEAGTGEHKDPHLTGVAQRIVQIVYFMLPRLDRFDVRTRLVQDMPIAFNYTWKAMSAGLIYVAVLLTIAYLVFSDREF